MPATDTLFSIYRSSAGSGKTRTLAREYLKLALQHRSGYFRHILAVTFANKATQEMKDRVLFYLDAFASGHPNDLADELKALLKMDDPVFRERSEETLREILHNYSQFSISTIDAFFQRVIRSFTREAGLTGDYRLEVDDEIVLEAVVNELIDELGSNKELTEWVVEFAKENLENDKAWDVRRNLIGFASEIFKEQFKYIEDSIVERTADNAFFSRFIGQLRDTNFAFVNFIRGRARSAMTIIHQAGLTMNDFKWMGGGIYNFFRKLTFINKPSDFKDKGKRAEGEYQDPKEWPNKKSSQRELIIRLASEKLIPILNEILEYRDKNYEIAVSAEVVLKNFYAFGLVSDISRKLKEYKAHNNIMLLSDAPKFLNGVIAESDTPFVYEKVGSYYRNFLIDEFQDTSGFQWRNFLPLVMNNLDQGYPSMVVGDVKQAIYRWRGGDLKLLQEKVAAEVGPERVTIHELDKNFRSVSTIVQFNNNLFATAPLYIAEKSEAMLAPEAFHDVNQQPFRTDTNGFVRIKFFPTGDDQDVWMKPALDQLVTWLEDLQQSGASLRDIAILVRKNYEGQQIANHLLEIKRSGKAKPGCRYDVISNESLRIDGASGVNLLLAAMRYLLNSEDVIARAQLGYECIRVQDPNRPLTEVFSVTNQATFESNLPEAFTRHKATLKKLPLFELTETLIEAFDLGSRTGELPYLQAFQDIVLDFFNRERNDLGAFLEWWELHKHDKSIQVAGEADAIRILTIHKSKGLQFKYVVLPFCSWPLDHENNKRPYLWVKSDLPLLKEAGYLPVDYASVLDGSCFRDAYEEERASTYLDNLNLLYVAFTRAMEGMLVTAPDVKSETVAGMLKESITRNPELEKNWYEQNKELSIGEWNTSTLPVSDSNEGLRLKKYYSARWRDKLVVRNAGKSFFEDEVDEKRKQVVYGMQMHSLLSRITYLDTLPAAINSVIREGLIPADEEIQFTEQVNRLLAHPEVSGWFDKKWTVYTEVPILLPGGQERRIDRLLTDNKKAIVIDFKTGDSAAADKKQVLEYMNILRQMNYQEVEGYLLYIKEHRVVPVTAGKPTRLKTKNENQLDLGL